MGRMLALQLTMFRPQKQSNLWLRFVNGLKLAYLIFGRSN